MDAAAFFASIADDQAAARLAGPLLALWYEARGEWDRAHAIVQGDSSAHAARVHAYLHRKEGDLSNARYWYQRAGVEPAQGSLEAEWRNLALALLARLTGDRALDT